GLSTRRVSDAVGARSLPSGATTACTSDGRFHVPSLAMTPYAAASCSAVAVVLWPIGTEPYDDPDHCSGGSSAPDASPGSPTPVASPRPNACWYSYRVRAPSSSAMRMVPTLEENARIADRVIRVPGGCHLPTSQKTVSPFWILGSTVTVSSGPITPSSSAAPITSGLCTDPGSNTTEVAASRQR